MKSCNILHVDFGNSLKNKYRCTQCGFLNHPESLYCLSCSLPMQSKTYNKYSFKRTKCLYVLFEGLEASFNDEINVASDFLSLFISEIQNIALKFNGIVRYILDYEVLLNFGIDDVTEHDAHNATEASFKIVELINYLNKKFGFFIKTKIILCLAKTNVIVDDDGNEYISYFPIILSGSIYDKRNLYSEIKESSIFCTSSFKEILRDKYIFYEVKNKKSNSLNLFEIEKKDLMNNSVDFFIKNKTPLIGRDAEIETIYNFYIKNNFVAFMLIGELGIGKTRISNEVIKKLHKIPFCIQSFDEYKNVPFYPLLNFVKLYFKSDLHDNFFENLEKKIKEIGLNLKDYISIFFDMYGDIFPNNIKITELCPEETHLKIKNLVIATLVHIASKSDSIFLFEDIHLADSFTINILNDFLSKDHKGSIIFTSRIYLKDLNIGNIIKLNPLWDHEIKKIALFFDASLEEDKLELIAKRSDGNPFFAEEVTKGILENKSNKIPDSIHDMMLSRLNNLLDIEKKILQFIALLGVEVTEELLLIFASDFNIDICVFLERMQERNILCKLKNGFFVFTHSLLAEVVIEFLSKEEKQNLHRKVAEVLKKRKFRFELIAFHFELSKNYEGASYHWLKAGEEALKKYLPKSASNFFSKSILNAKKSNNNNLLVLGIKNICNVSRFFDSNFFSDDFEKSIVKLVDQSRKEEIKFEIYLMLSFIKHISGDTLKSLEYHRIAKNLYNENKLFFLEQHSELVAKYISLDTKLSFFNENKIYNDKLNFFIDLFLKKEEISSYVIVLSNLVLVSFLSKKYEDVFLYSTDLLNIKNKYNDIYYQYWAEIHRDFVLTYMGDHHSVNRVIKTFETYCEFADKNAYFSYWSLVTATACKVSGRVKDAELYLINAIDHCDKTGFKRYQSYLINLLNEVQ